MNELHLQFLASEDWARILESELFPWVDRVAQLGDDVLEVGPGPGLTTDLLRRRAKRVTAVELDANLASALAERLAGTNVDVINADAANCGLEDNRFSSVTCFSMLHHVPSEDAQDRIFAEVSRVLAPGHPLIAADSLDVDLIREFHHDDIFVPLDLDSLEGRLSSAGFTNLLLETNEYEVRFRALAG